MAPGHDMLPEVVTHSSISKYSSSADHTRNKLLQSRPNYYFCISGTKTTRWV